MVIGAALKFGSQALRAAPGAFGAASAAWKTLPGPVQFIGGKALEYTTVVPALGAAAMAAGLPFGAPKPPTAAGAMPGGMMGGMGMPMNPDQFNSLYGSPGWSLPWQKEPGLYERMQNRQLGAQRGMFDAGQTTQRMGIQRNYDLGLDSNRTSLGMAGITAGTQKYLGDRQQRIADLTTSRQLQGLMDSNKTSAKIADLTSFRQLNAVYDNNRTGVRIADIGANRDRYVADRGVEVARWGGSVPRIATFGALMR
ncbi:hypothetical protein AB3R30_25575 [Leptolyngbyaceae cyanobacterium UHCC 1019]